MKEFILKNKWLGFVILLVYALIAASVVSKFGNAVVKEYAPIIVQEAEQFLPITLQNGEIVEPQNVVKIQSYGDEDGQNFNVVLNTQVDELEATSLSENGLYLSKKFIYAVSPQKTEIRSLKDMPDGTLDSETLNAGAEALVKNARKYLFIGYALFCILVAMISILLYTVVIHWLMAMLFKVKFGNTLRLNTLTYALIGTASVLGGFSVGILLMLVIMLAVNAAVNSIGKKDVTA